MPMVVIPAALAAGFSIAAGATIFSLGVYASAAVVFAASVAMSFVSQALAPKPKTADFPSVISASQDRSVGIRQPITARRIVYGRGRYSGAVTFYQVTGASKEFLHIVYTIAGHKFRSIDTLMLDADEVPLDGAQGVYGGNATGKYAGFVTAIFGLGDVAGDAAFNAALQADCPGKWTADHRQTGCAKIYVKLKFDSTVFPGAIPNVSVIGDGRCDIEDPRIAGSPAVTAWTDNAALCVASYLRDAQLGVGATAAEIGVDDLIAAANICDEMVNRNPVSVAFTAAAPDAGSPTIYRNTITVAVGTSTVGANSSAIVSLTGGTPIGTLTEGKGLAAAFDGITVDRSTNYANADNVSAFLNNTAIGYVGKDFGAPVAVAQFRAIGHQLWGFNSNGSSDDITISLLGSDANDPAAAVTVASLVVTNAPALMADLAVAESPTPSYRYWWLGLSHASASAGLTVTEALFYTAPIAGDLRLEALRLGTRVTVANVGGALPGGLAPATESFWIPVSRDTGKLAASLADARARAPVTLHDAGTGAQTLIVDAEPRYTCNGEIQTDKQPGEILGKLLSAMAGKLVYAGGVYRLYAGAWRSPASTAELTKDNLDGPIRATTRRSRRDLFNGVKGTFVSPDDNFQPISFPVVQVDDYVAEDNDEEIWQTAEYPFTDSPSMAQRVARIALEQNRRQIACEWPCNLSALAHQAADTVMLTNANWGWNRKTFEISSFSFAIRDDQSAPRLGVDLKLQEADSAIYAWDETVHEQPLIRSQATNLPAPSIVAPPTDLTLASGLAVALIAEDGSFRNRIKAGWTAPADQFVLSGGWIDIQYRLHSATDWTPAPSVTGDQVEGSIFGIADGAVYDVRIRARSGLNAVSAWVESDGYTVLPVLIDASYYRISGLELFGQGNDVQFGGRDAKFVWRVQSLYFSYDLGSEPAGGNSGRQDYTFRDYVVTLTDPATGDELRTEHVLDPIYIYSWERNLEDQRRITGDDTAQALREFTISVARRDIVNALSPAAAITVDNAAPGLPTGFAIAPEYNGFVASYALSPDPDFRGLQLNASTIDGFTPAPANLVYDGPDTRIPIGGLAGGTLYYVRARPYDAFGPDASDYSGQFAVAPLAVPDTSAPGAPTGLALSQEKSTAGDGTSIIALKAAWTANVEGDLKNYIVRWRQSGGSYSYDTPATNASPAYRIPGVVSGVTYELGVAAEDFSGNKSAFTADATLAITVDTIAPGAATALTATAIFRGFALEVLNPAVNADSSALLDLAGIQIWEAATNDRSLATLIHTIATDSAGAYVKWPRTGLAAGDVRYYWCRAIDRSGNTGAYFPAGATAGVAATASFLDLADLKAESIWAARAYVGDQKIVIDGVIGCITMFNAQGVPRVRLGTLLVEGRAALFNYDYDVYVIVGEAAGIFTTPTGASPASHDSGLPNAGYGSDITLLGVAAAPGGPTVAVGHAGAICSAADPTAAWTALAASQKATHETLQDISYSARFDFLAVGTRGALIQSLTGTGGWTAKHPPDTANLNAVLCTESLAIVGNRNGIWTSPDLVVWTKRATADTLHLAWDGTTYVACGRAGNLWTAADPTGAWTQRDAGTTSDNLYGVAKVGGTWCVCGTRGWCIISTDAGATWTPQTLDVTPYTMWALCGTSSGSPSGGDRFLALCGNGRIVTSPAGTVWSEAAAAGALGLNNGISILTGEKTQVIGYDGLTEGSVGSNAIAYGALIDIPGSASSAPVVLSGAYQDLGVNAAASADASVAAVELTLNLVNYDLAAHQVTVQILAAGSPVQALGPDRYVWLPASDGVTPVRMTESFDYLDTGVLDIGESYSAQAKTEGGSPMAVTVTAANLVVTAYKGAS